MDIDEILCVPLLLSLSWMLGSSLDLVFNKRLGADEPQEPAIE